LSLSKKACAPSRTRPPRALVPPPPKPRPLGPPTPWKSRRGQCECVRVRERAGPNSNHPLALGKREGPFAQALARSRAPLALSSCTPPPLLPPPPTPRPPRERAGTHRPGLPGGSPRPPRRRARPGRRPWPRPRGKSKKRSRPSTAPSFRHQSHRCTLTHARKRGSSLHWVCGMSCGVGRACTLAKNLAAVGASRRVDRLWRRPRLRVGAEAVVNAVVEGHGRPRPLLDTLGNSCLSTDESDCIFLHSGPFTYSRCAAAGLRSARRGGRAQLKLID
jgi:hypothetical protein